MVEWLFKLVYQPANIYLQLLAVEISRELRWQNDKKNGLILRIKTLNVRPSVAMLAMAKLLHKTVFIVSFYNLKNFRM